MQSEPGEKEQAEQSARANSAGAKGIFIFEHSRQEATGTEKRMNQINLLSIDWLYFEW